MKKARRWICGEALNEAVHSFSEADFNIFLRQTILRTFKISHRMLASLMSDTHRILFTHGDLSPRNIIVQDGRIVDLLDWETAGLYPKY